MKEYIRQPYFDALFKGLTGEPRLLQVIVGPRQVGKTTLALQMSKQWRGPFLYESADLPILPDAGWIIRHWQECRKLSLPKGRECLLILDEIQKIPRWSEAVKKMNDEDKNTGRRIRVVLLGSSSLLMQRGLTESLAGRFELHRHPQWSYAECREFFKLTLAEYLFFGGYPGALPLRNNEQRWSRYVRDSLIETVLGKDVLLMTAVNKPALLRQVFGLCLAHPAEIVSYQKMLGQLHDAGNTTTIASYIRLLADAFLFASLEKYSGSKIRQRGSMPKVLVLDNALIAANVAPGFRLTLQDKAFWGRMVENAVGAKLHAWLQENGGRLCYWRDRNDEVDYVIEWRSRLIAVEVKSGIPGKALAGLKIFCNRYPQAESVLIYAGNEKEKSLQDKYGIRSVALENFLLNPSVIFGTKDSTPSKIKY